MPSSISRVNLRLYLQKCRHRRSEENQGTDDPYAPNLDTEFTDDGTYYLLSGVVPTRGPGGFIFTGTMAAPAETPPQGPA